ncbi:LysR substrate-binding domain-containing protein [Streptomyces sp. RGM 3693]|uniref:LysR substrate-binding domain-containing protein n=1 Tax=Streptomyces sp. RGM 3693 TaxID=3413284 RepID=UPI003D27BCBF
MLDACRGAGFEPVLDGTASGTTAWAGIAAGRGINLVVASLARQLPRNITLVSLTPPGPSLTIEAVWRTDHRHPATTHLLDVCADLYGAEDRLATG